MIFTGKCGNINCIIKITYYPTLPSEYHKSTSPNMYEEGTGLMTQGPTYLDANSPQAHSYDAKERVRAMSVQSEPSRTKGLSTKSCGYRCTQLS